jgi:hypothetical protein
MDTKDDEEKEVDENVEVNTDESTESDTTGSEMMDNTEISVGIESTVEIPVTLDEVAGTEKVLSDGLDERLATMMNLISELAIKVDTHAIHLSKIISAINVLEDTADNIVTVDDINKNNINTTSLLSSAIAKII